MMASTSNCAECCMHANPFQVQEIALSKKQQQKKDPSIFGKFASSCHFFILISRIQINNNQAKKSISKKTASKINTRTHT